MKATVDRRETGIPGSDASERVRQMGGPIAQRASKQSGNGPVPVLFGEKKTGSGRSRASQDAMEGPHAADVESDEENGNEWEPVRYTRSEVKRRLAEQNTPAAVPERATRNAPARRRTDDLPRQRGRLSGKAALVVGALALIALYLIVGLIYSAWVGVSNRLSYGPTPTTYLVAVVGDHDAPGHPTWVVAVNEHGTIIIQVAPGGDFSKAATYTVAAQTFHSWGNPDDVVVTLTVAGTGPAPNIMVRLQGDPDIGHFYQRPSAGFVLLNQQPGFRVGTFIDQ